MTPHRSADRVPFRIAPDGIAATGKDLSGRVPVFPDGRAAAERGDRDGHVRRAEVGEGLAAGAAGQGGRLRRPADDREGEHPLYVKTDPVEDLAVASDGSLLDGWTYERECLEDEDEDGLFLVRPRVARGRGGEGNEKICERLVWFSGSGSGGEGPR